MASEDLTVAEALARVLTLAVATLSSETIPLSATLGRILTHDVVATEQLPPFANSAMDGYALRTADIQTVPAQLRVIADIAAGQAPAVAIRPGTAARIMTGAPMPAGADGVIPVEDTNDAWRDRERPLLGEVEVRRTLQPGDYVRPAGEDVQVGDVVISAGALVRPAEVAVLASLGRGMVEVVRRPLVGILSTGDELVEIDQLLTPGKIRNSNGYTQMAQVLEAGGIPLMLGIAADSLDDVTRKLAAGVAAGVDVLISSAGVSVGAYDVVKEALTQNGEVGFWRVRMRPGKPLAVGRYQGVPFLGLPGNPVSAMVSFERFVRPLLLRLGGHTQIERRQLTVVVREDVVSDGRESYLRAIVTSTAQGGYEAIPSGGQGSNMLSSLVKANALLIMPEGVREVKSGKLLQAMMLDSF